MTLTGVSALLRLGEMTVPNSPLRRSSKKLVMWHSVKVFSDYFSFHLPFHKADRLYQGSVVIVRHYGDPCLAALPAVLAYLVSRDASFPLHPELWLTSSSVVPSYSWFVSCLQAVLGKHVTGHSLRSGGATALALAAVPDSMIQATGHWTSDTFHSYIWQHLVILQALLHGSAHHKP
jgi:hypothetical protein